MASLRLLFGLVLALILQSTIAAPTPDSLSPGASIPLADARFAPQRRDEGETSGKQSLPRAFDASLGSNFTVPACESFLKSMVADPNFQACHPVSLMLQNSVSWFQATKSAAAITQALSASCSAPLDSCTDLMYEYANGLLETEYCATDFTNENPIVVEAYFGLNAFSAIYHATCLKDDTPENNFCYTNAVTNASAPTNSYVYFIGLGTPLPTGAIPTCNRCLKETMSGFSTYASNSSQPASRAYPSAAQQFNAYCGPTFAITDVEVTKSGASSFTRSAPIIASAVATWLAFFL